MRRKDPEAEHFFESHLSHLICIGQWTLCSRPKGILDVEYYSALAAPARLMKLARLWMTWKDPRPVSFFQHTLRFIFILRAIIMIRMSKYVRENLILNIGCYRNRPSQISFVCSWPNEQALLSFELPWCAPRWDSNPRPWKTERPFVAEVARIKLSPSTVITATGLSWG